VREGDAAAAAVAPIVELVLKVVVVQSQGGWGR
jgi:hypothetical protein